MNPKDLARYYAAGRLGIGLLLLAFPGRVLQGMLGGRHAVTPGVKLLGRMVGGRDAILGAGSQIALGRDGGTSARDWATYGGIADAVDALAMALVYRHLPKRKRFAMLALAIGGAATGARLRTSLPT